MFVSLLAYSYVCLYAFISVIVFITMYICPSVYDIRGGNRNIRICAKCCNYTNVLFAMHFVNDYLEINANNGWSDLNSHPANVNLTPYVNAHTYLRWCTKSKFRKLSIYCTPAPTLMSNNARHVFACIVISLH